MMIKDAEANPGFEPGPSSQPEAAKKPYESPRLLEWGSLSELTAGPLADIQDDDFSGSGGV